MELLGNICIYTASFLWAWGLAPQIYRVWRRKSTWDLSLTAYVLSITAMIFFMIGMLIREQWFVVVCELQPLVLTGVVIWQIIYYRRRKRDV